MTNSTSEIAVRRNSLRSAIDAKCNDCIYDGHAPGTWREQVAQCSALECPLWPVRPAPHSGPFACPYRDPDNVPQEWVTLPVGSAFSPRPWGHEGQTEVLTRVEEQS